MATIIKATPEVVQDYWQALRESPRVHDAVHAAAPGNRAALLLPAKQERDRHTPDADR